MKLDVIVAWPKNNDYPLWRLFLSENKEVFNKVYVVFTEAPQGDDYSEFVTSELSKIDNVVVLNSPPLKPGQDWRDVAVKEAFKHSRADWVWFTEQDFEAKGGFFKEVEKMVNDGYQVMAAYQQTRIHPCSIFIKRDLLIKLTLDFGIVPNKLDHFGLIQKQIEEMGVDVGKINPNNYYHYNGLSHNFNLLNMDQEVVYEPVVFARYLAACLEAPVVLHPKFTELAKKAISAYLPQ